MSRARRVYLCGADDMGERVIPNMECLFSRQHTPKPPGYLQFFEWAEEMQRTHRQGLCGGCDRWTIWEPK